MSMGSKRGRSARAVPYINVTPLIDVLLVMLIIFMVITPLKPSHFQADIPSQPDKTPQTHPPEANPLTLVVGLSSDGKITLNKANKDHPGDKPVGDEPCVGVVPDYGTVEAPGNLAKCLNFMLQQRKEKHIYKDPLPPNLTSEDQKIERTVFIKAPRGLRYGDVVKVIDAIKGAGANPIGLQVDGLESN